MRKQKLIVRVVIIIISDQRVAFFRHAICDGKTIEGKGVAMNL